MPRKPRPLQYRSSLTSAIRNGRLTHKGLLFELPICTERSASHTGVASLRSGSAANPEPLRHPTR